jgi:putative DNA primase/helicase
MSEQTTPNNITAFVIDGSTEQPEPAGRRNGACKDPAQGDTAALSDLALARRLAKKYGDDLKHHSAFGWLEWDFRRFEQNEKGARRRAYKLGAMLRQEVLNQGIVDPARVQAWYKAAKRAESAGGVNAVLEMARALESFDADHIEFDANGWLLNCVNGTVDLRTGELREHRRADYITALCPTAFDPDAECPRFTEFLASIFCGDVELIAYFQYVAGYVLTGSTAWQVFFILWGHGSNGKSTLIQILMAVLGPDFTHQIDPEELMAQKYARHTTELAALRGKRLVAAVETTQGRRINESLIKALSGGDSIRARFMKKDSFEFVPTLKLFISTNHKPAIRDASEGMRRRLRLIPFSAHFEGDSRDSNLLDKLKDEAPGILAWCVRGAVHAAKGEPALPACVRLASDTYLSEQDVLGQFLEQCCEKWDFAQVGKGDLYRAYTAWTGGKCESQREFNSRLSERGFADDRATGGKRVWRGIALIQDNLNEGSDAK